MAHITKRNGRWQAADRGPDRRERTQTFSRKVDADRWLAAVTTDIARGTYVDPRLGKTLFSVWADQWTGTTVANRITTRTRDKSYLRTHILPVFGDLPLTAIDYLSVRTWVSELSTRRAPATVRLACHLLSKILGAAVDAGLITANPCDRVPLPRVEREEMRFLSPDQIGHLANAMDPRYRALVLVGAYGGLRIGELAGLRRSRVDLLRGKIDVARPSHLRTTKDQGGTPVANTPPSRRRRTGDSYQSLGRHGIRFPVP
jgi:integrase